MKLPVLASPPTPTAPDYLSRLGDDVRQPTGPVAARPLPMTMQEARDRGWDELDIVFITGDAYIDHPSFAMAILGRVLEAAGYRIGIVSQPDWHSCEDWKRFGKPRLFFGISAGNMDSMINHYTANKKVRNDDAYSPGGQIGRRPDRATLAYCQRAREAYKGVPVIAVVSKPAYDDWLITITGATKFGVRFCSIAKPTWLPSVWAKTRSLKSRAG